MNFIHEKNRIYVEDEQGKVIAEVDFPDVSQNKVNINHTYVDRSLRGQGVADKLLTHAVEEIRKNNKKAVATCSYAVEWFEKHTEHEDILA